MKQSMFDTLMSMIKQGKIRNLDKLVDTCDMLGIDIVPMIRLPKVHRISGKLAKRLNIIIMDGGS